MTAVSSLAYSTGIALTASARPPVLAGVWYQLGASGLARSTLSQFVVGKTRSDDFDEGLCRPLAVEYERRASAAPFMDQQLPLGRK